MSEPRRDAANCQHSWAEVAREDGLRVECVKCGRVFAPEWVRGLQA